MSLKNSADHLAAQGRDGDTLLVHMTPGEVAGLDALARQHYGKGLPINPRTGLPEANLLKSLLPAIAGGLLAATGIGAPAAALIVGGGSALASHSLSKGIMSGLGAFGGAGMGAALMGGGAAAAGAAGAGAAGAGAAGAGAAEGAGAAGMAGSLGDVTAAGYDPLYEGAIGAGVGGGGAAAGAGGSSFLNGMTPAKWMAAQGGGMGVLQNGMMALAPSMDPSFDMFGQDKVQGAGAPVDDDNYIRPYNYNPQTGYTRLEPYKSKGAGARFADGGIAGLLQGPGDGTSDSIPAQMSGGGPAALGDGEFVIPARIVSEIGNGSTDAGAKRLYAMMERIQSQRSRTTGPDSVAKDTKAERYMPS